MSYLQNELPRSFKTPQGEHTKGTVPVENLKFTFDCKD